jgi:acyl-CoA thioester hydrolase
MTDLPPVFSPQLGAVYDGWFNYPVRVYPHHTDYAGMVWHGSYLTWMEEARVECLRSVGISFEDLVAAGVNLPVVNLSMRYHLPAKMGEDLIVMTKLQTPEKLRLNWEYQIRTETDLCVSALVTLVAVDMEKNKIFRTLPSPLDDAIARLMGNEIIPS